MAHEDPTHNSYTHRKRQNFTIIQNDLIRDNSLSCKAFKLLCIGLSHSGSWEFNKSQIATCFKEGSHTVNSAMTELRESGYLHLVAKVSKRGLFDGHAWFWFESPITAEEFKKFHRDGGFQDFGKIRASENDDGIRIPSSKKTNSLKEEEEEDAHTHVDKEEPKKEKPLAAGADPTFCLLQGLVGRQRAETLWMQSVRNQYDIADVVKYCLRSDSVKSPEKLIGAAIRDRADYSERPKDQHRSAQRANREVTPTKSPERQEVPSESLKNDWPSDIILRCAEWCESRGYDNILDTPDGWVETWIKKTGQDREEVLAKNRKENEK